MSVHGLAVSEKSACLRLQAANVLINQDGRVVLSDFGVTANLERATPSSLRRISHSQASTSDAAGVAPLPLGVDTCPGEMTADMADCLHSSCVVIEN